MSWRPDDWENCKLYCDEKQDGQDSYEVAFEAGAEAMLEALKANGPYGDWYQDHDGYWHEASGYEEEENITGWLVCIREGKP